jgi:hypothetical protein
MAFIIISGFYPEPDPDNSLHYEKRVPSTLEGTVLAAMEWKTLRDVPPGETNLSQKQARVIVETLGDVFRNDLAYSIGLFR